MFDYRRKHKMLEKIEKRAVRKGIPFDLDVNWLSIKLAQGCCESTGLPFKEFPACLHENPYLPSIDRIDSNKGYTKDNCKLVVVGFNSLKSNFDDEIVLRFCENFVKIYEEKNK